MPGADLRHGSVFLAAFPTRIAHEPLLRFLLAGERDLFRIDHHHEITRVQVRREDRLVLSTQQIGDLHRQPTQHRALCIDDVPFALVQIHFRQKRFHSNPDFRSGQTSKQPTRVKAHFERFRAACPCRPPLQPWLPRVEAAANSVDRRFTGLVFCALPCRASFLFHSPASTARAAAASPPKSASSGDPAARASRATSPHREYHSSPRLALTRLLDCRPSNGPRCRPGRPALRNCPPACCPRFPPAR